MLQTDDAMPVKRNSLICPCCLQFVEDAAFLADPMNQIITNGDKTVRLTRQQFKVAKFLIDRYPLLATKEALYDNCFMDIHGEGPDIKIVDVIICKIRPRLADVGLVIETAWGQGYKLVKADPTAGNIIKDASIRNRAPGSAHRWLPEHDVQLLELMARKMKPPACATTMKMPYMAVERAYKRLLPTVEASAC